jgi:hypothetical protein
MKIHRHVIVFDAADLAAESAFWADLLGGAVVADDDWHGVINEAAITAFLERFSRDG